VSGKLVESSAVLRDVRYEIRGQLANHALELEKRGYEIISLNIGNPGLFGFRTPETMRLAMIENLAQAEPYCQRSGGHATAKPGRAGCDS
jgi:alanine-synthesizing transaminase